jgi:hypothetical protein
MATENGPDLTSAREAVERLMDDTCTIQAPAPGGAIDPATGEVVQFAADTIYDGKCKVRPGPGGEPEDESRGGDLREFATHELGILWDAPAIPRGALVTITSSRRDPLLVDRTFTAGRSVTKTFLVQRTVYMEDRP